MPDGGSSKKSKKSDTPVEVTVADNPNYIPVQQPQAFAPGMQLALARQLNAGYGTGGGILGVNNGATEKDYYGLLSSIYSPQAVAADPIGVAQQAAAAAGQQAPQNAVPLINRPGQQGAAVNEGLRGGRNMGGQR